MNVGAAHYYQKQYREAIKYGFSPPHNQAFSAIPRGESK